MKRKWTKNLGLKILSLGLAIIIWIVVVNIDDPAITRTFRLSVDIRNANVIADKGMCYEVVEGDSVTITVKGKRSVVQSLTTADFRAYADLSKLSIWHAVPIKVELTKYLTEEDTPNIALGSVDTLIVSLEDIATKQFKVTVVKKGTVEDGYTIGDLKAKPNIVQVSGAASQIEKIDQLRVEIDVSNESEDFTTTGVPKVFDADGREINSTNMTFGVSEVKVTGTLLNTKTVPLNIEVTGEPADGYQYISVDYEPKSIVVAGEESNLAKISAVTIPFDIEGKYSDIESEVTLADYIPKGIELTEDSQTVMVNVKIQKLQSKVFTFSVKNVQVKNLSDSMVFNFDPSTSSDDITVRVLGLEEDLDKLTINDLDPYIDLKGLNKEGAQIVEIQFQNVEGIRIQNKPTVNIELAKIADENAAGNEPNITDPTNETEPIQGDTGEENQNTSVNTEDENTDEVISDINGNE